MRSIAWKVEFFPQVEFFPTVQAKPAQPVSQTGLTGLALWAVAKSFEQEVFYHAMASLVQRRRDS
jgi:hypothetical protein